MTTTITKKQKCLTTRDGLELWVDDDQAVNIENALINNAGKFLSIDGRLVNTADITGIYLPEDMENRRKVKQGLWKCAEGNWHARDEVNCDCWKLKK